MLIYSGCFHFQLEDTDSIISSGFAIFLLHQHFNSLYQKIYNPTSVADTLYFEGVFVEQCWDKDSVNISSLEPVFYYTLREAVCLSHYNLKVFASVLFKYKSTVCFGQELLKEYSKLFM